MPKTHVRFVHPYPFNINYTGLQQMENNMHSFHETTQGGRIQARGAAKMIPVMGGCLTTALIRWAMALKPNSSPQRNGIAESFVKTLKRDYAKLANRPDSKTVMAQLKDWFDDYNSYHPHSALGYLPPTLFREKRSVT